MGSFCVGGCYALYEMTALNGIKELTMNADKAGIDGVFGWNSLGCDKLCFLFFCQGVCDTRQKRERSG
jgi:hypothetical protein